ncbi:MAG: ABC transporter substrate-binding protein [Chloroflexi bacterium]|nr:ABC transporter substrate-binding protein [Chloroflexota bacterium]
MRAATRWIGMIVASGLAILMALALSIQPVVAPPPALAQGLTRLRTGLLSSASDAGFFIAMDQGYFREVGIELDITPFDSAANMVAPLGTGQLDLGGGSHSAGLYNAIARGVGIKLVADKGSSLPGFGFQGLLFRRDLAESGTLRTPADLRGRRISVPAQGITPEAALGRWLQREGLSLDDVNIVLLNFADHPQALATGAIDASVTIEPFLTRALDIGAATLYQRTDELLPGYQIAEVLYSQQFINEQPDAARRFMIAYLRGVRFYNDAYVKGDAAKRQQVVESLTRHTPVKDAALYDRMAMPGLNPDGRMSINSLADDQEFWLARGVQQQRIDMSQLVDTQFIEAAVQVLGPYE